jgi:hypothetical protein
MIEGGTMQPNFEIYRNQCLQVRSEYLFRGLRGKKFVPALSPRIGRWTCATAAAFGIAAVTFWAVMFIATPITKAYEAPAGLNITEVLKDAPNLPGGDTYETF